MFLKIWLLIIFACRQKPFEWEPFSNGAWWNLSGRRICSGCAGNSRQRKVSRLYCKVRPKSWFSLPLPLKLFTQNSFFYNKSLRLLFCNGEATSWLPVKWDGVKEWGEDEVVPLEAQEETANGGVEGYEGKKSKTICDGDRSHEL